MDPLIAFVLRHKVILSYSKTISTVFSSLYRYFLLPSLLPGIDFVENFLGACWLLLLEDGLAGCEDLELFQ